MALAGALEIQIYAEIARLRSDMEKATGIVSKAGKTMEGAVGSVKTALASLGIGLGVGYFVSLTKGSIDAADHLNDLTQSLGVNMQALAKYKLATDQSGSSLEGLGKGIKGLTTAFAEHGDELRAAGITAKTADGQIRQLADIFSKMPDGLEKTTLATKLFGKSGMELIPMLNMGAKGLDETAEKSAKYAAVLTEMGPRADHFNDTMAELAMASKVASMALINDALPAMTDIAKAMAIAAHESGGLKAAWVGFGGISWEGVFKPLTALIQGATASLMELNARMLKFFGDNKGAAYEFQRAARMWEKVAALQSAPPAPQSAKQFDTEAWTAQYKKLADALGIGKKATEDADATYRGLLKTLKEKLLVDKDLTEVAKLQLALDALSAKNRATITPEREKELKDLAVKVDLMKREKDAMENNAKNEDALAKMRQEGAEMMAAAEKVRGDAILAADKQIEQMKFETTLIGMTNVERETAIFLRQAEIDKIDAATIARMKEAIAAKHVAEEAKATQVSMWQSVESAGHQAFLSIFDTSKNVLERIRDMLKTHLIDILYQVTIKKWIVQIVASASGAGVAQSAFGSSGDVLSMASNANSLIGGGFASGYASTAFLPAAEAAAMIEAGTVGAAGLGMEAGALGIGATGTAMTALTAAAPYVAAALLAGKALGVFGDSGGGPAVGYGTGVQGAVSRSGFSGQLFGLSQNSETKFRDPYLVPGGPKYLQDAMSRAASDAFEKMAALAQKMGVSADALSSASFPVNFEVGAGSMSEDPAVRTAAMVEALNAAMASMTDQMALELMPNIRDFAQGNESLTQTFERLSSAQTAVNDAAAAERYGLETRLLQLQGDTAALRERELAALNESNRGILKEIFALEDLATANEAAARAQQEAAAIAEAAANEAARAAQAAADERARIEQVAAAKAAQIASERYNLETQLLQAQGDTATLRERELAALDESNRLILKQVFALQDQRVAEDVAAKATQEAAAVSAKAADDQLRAAEKLKSAWQSVTDSIVDEIQRIRGLTGATPASLAAARAQFAISTAAARAGDLDAAKLLPGLSRSVIEMATATARSAVDIARVRAQVLASLETTAGMSASTFGLTLPGFASGTSYVPSTGPAILHRGERVFTAAANDELIAEIQALRAEVSELKGEARKTEWNTRKTSNVIDGVAHGELSFSTTAA